MPYAVEFEDKPDYLHAKVTGVNSKETVIEYTHDVHKACVERGCRALLIEENLSGPSLDIASIFRVADDRSRQAIGLLNWIAYVDVNEEHDRSRMKFAEDVAVGRGANMRLFRSVADAEHWLQTELDRAENAR